MSRASLFFLLTFAFPTLLHADPAADEATLKKAGVPGDGPALLKFLSGLVPRDSKLEDAALLVKRMASEDFFEREEALKKVIALGPRAAPFLRSALKESDKELVQRAEECLKIIEGGPGLDVHGATLRLIALRKPAGAAAAVLEYLPFVPNDRIGEEAAVTLAAVALEGGKVAPEFVKALGDSLAARRAAAAHVLAKVAFKEHRLELVKLLADGDPRVRFKTAVALAKHHEKEAVPVLIALLDKAPAADVASIEVMLQKLADHKGPAGPWTASAAMREAWQSWWTAHAATADLAKLTAIPKMLGHTLLVFAEEGKVEEIDKDGKLRWSFAGLQFPTVAHLVGDNKVLVAENRLRRVTLRSTTGAIERTFSVSLPTDVQMMPDGKVLAVSRLGLYEYNATGGLVRRITVPGRRSRHAFFPAARSGASPRPA
ncbi:MAG: HEAT repeat domain-containing protein [Gemmataceae bacterium]